jgi:hypothetical protein
MSSSSFSMYSSRLPSGKYMTGDVIRHLWPISLVLLPEAISRDAWRLLRFRRQSPIHCKSFDIFLSPELQHSKYLKKKGYQVEWKIKKKRKLAAIEIIC